MDKSSGEDQHSNGSNGSNEKEWNNYEDLHALKTSSETLYSQRIIDLSHLEQLYQSKASHGVVGSQNLGNTCFMNSSIQCMSNSIDLTAYFLSHTYKNEINPNNRFGLGGALAESWYDLLHDLWEDKNRSVNAGVFKNTISKKARMFSGYSQHDSHEFITFFLDYLNEDLNKVTVKPYREIEEQADNETDADAAKRFWQLHLDRNNSIVTDLFSGQFKSTIQCPNCNWISRTYDPFNTLSLPIPTLDQMSFFFVSKYGIRKTMKLQMEIPAYSLFGDLAHMIKSSHNLEADFEKLRFMIVKDNEMIKLALPKERIDKFLEVKDGILLFCCDTDSKLKGDIVNVPLYYMMNDTLGVYPRLLSLTNEMTFGYLKLLAFYYARKFIVMPNDQSEYEAETKILLEQFTKSSDKLIEICQKEYENLFKKGISSLSKKEKDFMHNLPYELYLKKEDKIKYIIRSPNKTNKNDVLIDLKDEESVRNLIAMQKDKWKFVLEFDIRNSFIIENVSRESKSCKNGFTERKCYSLSLTHCLESFQLTERLEKNNEWYCKKCKTHQLAHKKMEIFYLPKLLIIHLKRFSTESRGFGRNSYSNKISATVGFPLNDLDMSSFVVDPNADNSKYDLYAVSQHYGGCGGGHYTAVCKNNEKWYEYNDSSVSQTSENHVVSDAAYVLFYRRK